MNERKEKPELGETADPAKVGSARERDKVALSQAKADIIAVMDTPHGRRFVTQILRDTRVGEIAWFDNDRMTNFVLGHQNVGNKLIARLREFCLPLVRRMEDEERHDAGISK